MSGLFKRLYLTVLASLLLFVVLAGITFKLFANHDGPDRGDQIMAQLVSDALPAELSAEQIQQKLLRWQAKAGLDMTLYSATGSQLGQVGAPLDTPDAGQFERAIAGRRNWYRSDGRWVFLMPLNQGRVLVSTPSKDSDHWGGPGLTLAGVLGVLSLLGLAVAIVAYPTARRLTRRFEVLQDSVDAFGEGDLAARAPVKGNDDIARLASHFNRSADRIANLLRSQKSLLANASHELRSPLARIRMAVALFNQPGLNTADREAASRELLRNVGELDELVDELLTASRLDASNAGAAMAGRVEPWETFDLGGLVAEECARLNLAPSLSSMDMFGDRRLLRRLIRNLLENALRYGRSAGTSDADAISITLTSHERTDGPSLQLAVCDRGPGIPAAEVERIFEPFYRLRGASEKVGGVGLGLSLVRQIAHYHRGEVRCAPRERGGSCFHVELPARPGGNLDPATTG